MQLIIKQVVGHYPCKLRELLNDEANDGRGVPVKIRGFPRKRGISQSRGIPPGTPRNGTELLAWRRGFTKREDSKRNVFSAK